MQAIKSLVIGLGILIIAGLILLGYAFYSRMTDPEFQLMKEQRQQTAASRSSQRAGEGFGEAEIALARWLHHCRDEARRQMAVPPHRACRALRTGAYYRSAHRPCPRCPHRQAMNVIDAAPFRALVAAAETAYPEECCGLLIGRRDREGEVAISDVRESANVAPKDRGVRFELDPAVRLATVRALAGGPEIIVGHYHSHPDRPAQPSATDVALAYEPDLVWLIVAVFAGHVTEAAAFRIADARVIAIDLSVRPNSPQG